MMDLTFTHETIRTPRKRRLISIKEKSWAVGKCWSGEWHRDSAFIAHKKGNGGAREKDELHTILNQQTYPSGTWKAALEGLKTRITKDNYFKLTTISPTE